MRERKSKPPPASDVQLSAYSEVVTTKSNLKLSKQTITPAVIVDLSGGGGYPRKKTEVASIFATKVRFFTNVLYLYL